MSAVLHDIIRTKRLVVCCGSGGVGKTTTSAAIALAAAMEGRRTLVLTIDPARRLADSLGLDALDNTERLVPDAAFRAAGVEPRGELWAMMLDARTTFDRVIERVAPDAATRDRILGNRLYRTVSAHFAGSQEYMAMERLHLLFQENRYDLVVLDTPPTKNALDFLNAPNKLAQFFDDSVMRWFVQRGDEKKRRWGLLSAGTSLVHRLLGAMVGAAFVDEVVEFFTAFKDMYAGFRERAQGVNALLRADHTTFVLVTGPEGSHLDMARYFYEKLREHGLRVAAVVVNRAYREFAPGEPFTGGEVSLHDASAIHRLLTEEPGVSERLADLAAVLSEKLERAYAWNARMIDNVDRWTAGLGEPLQLYRVPVFSHDVHSMADLLRIRRYLLDAPR